MAKPRLSVRSAKARELAHRLARHKHRSTVDVVGREPPSAFYARLSHEFGDDVDVEPVIVEARHVDLGPDL